MNESGVKAASTHPTTLVSGHFEMLDKTKQDYPQSIKINEGDEVNAI